MELKLNRHQALLVRGLVSSHYDEATHFADDPDARASERAMASTNAIECALIRAELDRLLDGE